MFQERFMKVDYNMKWNIKEQLCKITYRETNNMKSVSNPLYTKDAPKKDKIVRLSNKMMYMCHMICFRQHPEVLKGMLR